MVQLTRIYTKSGDKGKSSLGGGERRLKNAPRFQAIGSVDEANATLGLVALHLTAPEEKKVIERIQNDLFDLGADLCTLEDTDYALRMQPSQTQWLETTIDAYNEHLDPLTSFVLPGGSMASAYLHAARTTVRRAERDMVALKENEEVNEHALTYINRLSDLLFVLGRFVNKKDGCGDVLWIPGENR
jgi:cob(I)alamin adenosyltransferase